jgi:homocysteine S-methyltransferase
LSAASIPAWISLCCRDDEQTCAGDPIEEAARAVEDVDAVVAIGINCTAPAHLLGLVERLSAVTQKAIIVYPNAGQTWNAITRRWEGPRDIDGWTTYCQEWWKAGARLIGGCCQTTPGHIRRLADEMNHARGLT